ncbi:FAD-binding oxidoreductase [Hylemonella gracilis]|uniref:FAD-binding oxidoreductase n=1 Tax=Hylemonella gracilis TaxID=80880 RepID=A0A4V1A1W0_9BURK|nr:FAD-binding oxidoreductase [Hylemonella gracilis]QBK03919.1 FAD-binding oxidoreductase [Hylemonella gracilis]
MSPTRFLEELTATLGPDLVLPGPEVPETYHTDWSGAPPVRPLALARPRNTPQVSALMRLCSAHRVPVVPQGGRTGLAGGAVPVPGCVLLSLERMHAIEQVDARTAVLKAQAGATLQAVQEAAQSVGLQFGVDLGARGSCQIGGNVATNAGGNGVLQFGMLREQVLGLEVVLADGTVLPMLRPMIKNNTGYDLKQFFIGAEGTLGIVTRVLLRLRPRPGARTTALLALPHFDAALALLARLRTYFGNDVAAFELMWDDFVQTSLAWQQLQAPFAQAHPLLALVDLDGRDEGGLHATVETVLDEALQAGEVVDAVLAQSTAQARALWKLREAPAEFPTRLRPPINFDVSLPQADIGRFADACRATLDARWPGHHTLFFGHVGDSNLHVTTDGASIDHQTELLEDLLYELVARFQGSVSAEHGIGLHKKPYLDLSRTPQELAAMRAIKQALDPLNLLNPGKIFGL